MDIKLFDSELKVMDVLWKRGDTDVYKRQAGRRSSGKSRPFSSRGKKGLRKHSPAPAR